MILKCNFKIQKYVVTSFVSDWKKKPTSIYNIIMF